MDFITTPTQTGYSPPANSVVHYTSASLTDRAPSEPVHIVQYDDTMPIIAVALSSNGQGYTVPSGAAVNFRMDKPDGTHIYNPALGVGVDGQTVYIGVTQQTAAKAGNMAPIVEIVVGATRAGSGAFEIIIDPSPVPENAIESQDEYLTMQQILAQVQQSAQIVSDNEAAINTVADNVASINTAAQNVGSINTVAGIASNVTAVAENTQNIQDVADNLPAIQDADENAASAAASATLSESWAVGGTGTRTGEDTNNSKFWSQQASQAANGYLGYFATPEGLQSAHPTGSAGNWATVGSTQSVWFWNGTAFVNTPGQATNTGFGVVKVSDAPNDSLTASGGWAASPKAVAPLLNIGEISIGQSVQATIPGNGGSGIIANISVPGPGIWLIFASGWTPGRAQGYINLLNQNSAIAQQTAGSYVFSLSGVLKTSGPVTINMQFVNWSDGPVISNAVTGLVFEAVLLTNTSQALQNYEGG